MPRRQGVRSSRTGWTKHKRKLRRLDHDIDQIDKCLKSWAILYPKSYAHLTKKRETRDQLRKEIRWKIKNGVTKSPNEKDTTRSDERG